MKGLLFSELLKMVEEDFGYKTANAIGLRFNMSPGRVCDVTRTHHCLKMSGLFERLQQQTNLSVEELSAAFGRHLCKRIIQVYPQHKAYVNRVFSMISKRGATTVFEYMQTGNEKVAVLYNPYAKATCLTEGMIKGYLDYLQQTSLTEETIFSDGRRKFVITLS
jgi:hypothetical protein